MIETVRGPIGLERLGTVLMHEHVFVTDPEVISNFGQQWWDEEERISDAVRKLQAAKDIGVDTIVDMTVLGIGRDIRLVQRVNAGVDINIVAATGLYTFDALPGLFRNEGPGTAVDTVEPMVEAFLADIRQGIAGTAVKAGMLKCVWETPTLTPSAERVQSAVCQTHVESGTPITVHTNADLQSGRAALDFYEAENVALDRVVVGHAGDSTNIDYLRALMDRGATIGCDRFGLDTYGNSYDRVQTIVTLCGLGYAERIVLSQDSAAFTESWARPAAAAALSRILPNWRYTYVLETVIPQLRDQGINEQQLRAMLVDNPRRLLGP